jgi:hypothetical protein
VDRPLEGVEIAGAAVGQRHDDAFRASTAEDIDEIPQTLSLVGTGSLRDRDRRLYIAFPSAATITPHDGCRVREFGCLGRFKTIEIDGHLSVSICGDTYDVHAGAEHAESTSIIASGTLHPNIGADCPVYLGCPSFTIQRGDLLRVRGDQKSLKIRCTNRAEKWSPFCSSKMPFGLVDVAALDANGSVLDRFRFVHLPDTTRVDIKIPKSDGGVCSISIEGLRTEQVVPRDQIHSKISIHDASPTCTVFDVITSGSRNEQIRLRIRWSNNEALISTSQATNRNTCNAQALSVCSLGDLNDATELRFEFFRAIGERQWTRFDLTTPMQGFVGRRQKAER